MTFQHSVVTCHTITVSPTDSRLALLEDIGNVIRASFPEQFPKLMV